MTDLDSTLSAIDSALGCQQCGGPLGDSPSEVFCGESCTLTWHARRIGSQCPKSATLTVSLARAAVRGPAHAARAEVHAVWANGQLSEQIVSPLDTGDLALVGFDGNVYYQTVTGAFTWPDPASQPGCGWTKVGPVDGIEVDT